MKMLVATGFEDLNLLFELSNLIEIKKTTVQVFCTVLHSTTSGHSGSRAVGNFSEIIFEIVNPLLCWSVSRLSLMMRDGLQD